MLDKESELYHSGLLDRSIGQDHAAVIITRDGVELSASSRGFSLEYSNTWSRIKEGIERANKRVKENQEKAVPLRAVEES